MAFRARTNIPTDGSQQVKVLQGFIWYFIMKRKNRIPCISNSTYIDLI